MEELMIVANVAIVFGVFYKLFELYARRKERIMLIEKLPPEMLGGQSDGGLKFNPSSSLFTALRLGCLFLGVGLGLIAGYCIVCNTLPGYFSGEGYNVCDTVSVIYGASVLIGGGIGLIAAFLIELKIGKKQKTLERNAEEL